MAKKAGRPTLYSEETIVKAEEYLASCVDTMENKGTEDKPFLVPAVKLPSIEGLSLYLGVTRECLYEWGRVHPLFSDTLEKLRAKQAEKLLNNGLSGTYNSSFHQITVCEKRVT